MIMYIKYGLLLKVMTNSRFKSKMLFFSLATVNNWDLNFFLNLTVEPINCSRCLECVIKYRKR